MVVFVDHGSAYAHLHSGGAINTLTKETGLVPLLSATPPSAIIADLSIKRGTDSQTTNPVSGEQSNPNASLGFAAALSCYPVVKEIARSVDLNTLHALSMTCRQFRANLLQFRNQLVRETLRCRNESLSVGESYTEYAGLGRNIPGVPAVLAPTSYGKRNRCARDMVGECQRCAKVVCRNCTMKVPSTAVLKNRLRRLCPTCLAAPLSHHLSPHGPEKTDNLNPSIEPWNLTCSCETHVWLCKPCGQTLRSEDTAYKRVWTWRTRYSAYLGGGLGTGIGDGCQGVTCGRGDMCLAAEDTEVEVDCEVDEWMSEHPDYHHHHDSHAEHLLHVECRDDEEPGYLRQEIEGIGGVVKQKIKKRVRVGASVEEFDGERESGKYLQREALGDVRSWCVWCWRVMPSNAELVQLEPTSS
ncbi:hypothetical protein VTO42DRAFT_2665 [Malbranchea cinnamomea]